MLFEHLCSVRPITLRLTYAELSGETALDFMVEGATASPLPAGAADILSPRVKALVEEHTVRGFRVKLVI